MKAFYCFSRRGHSIIGLFLIVTLLLLLGNSQALSYERKVLFEDFTSTTCPPCAAAAAAIESGLELVGDEHVAAIAIHVWWPGAGNDPWWLDNQADNRARVNYYGVNSVPRYFIDGSQYNGSRTAQAVASAIQNRGRVESPLQIAMRAAMAPDHLRATVTVTAEEDVRNVNLFLSLNDDHVEYNAPTGQRDHYDSMVKMFPDGNGTRFSLDEGDSRVFEFDEDLEGYGWHELDPSNSILVAWVQDSGDREVLQSQNLFFNNQNPLITLVGWEMEESEGNQDGRPEPGETIDVAITIDNAPNFLPAEDVEVTFTTDDEEIEIIQGSFELDELENGAQFTNDENPFQFSVSAEWEPHPVIFTISITAQPEDYSTEDEISIMIGWPAILVVDASANGPAHAAMLGVFGMSGIPWAEPWNRLDDGEITSEDLERYPIVLWHSFNNQYDIISADEEQVLMDFLDNGGTLIMSSVYYVVNNEDSRLMSDYFKAELDQMHVRGGGFVYGYADDPHFDGASFFLGAGDGAGFPDMEPTLTVLEGARAALHEATDQVDGEDLGVVGISHDTEDYHALLLSFPIESIGGVMGDTREMFMQRVIDWINNPAAPESVGGETAVPSVFSLAPAFPNPFNATSVVPFSLESEGFVTLTLFDVSGREVTRLFEGNLSAGSHSAVLDASAIGLGSGVYYLRLKSADHIQGQKVLYLR